MFSNVNIVCKQNPRHRSVAETRRWTRTPQVNLLRRITLGSLLLWHYEVCLDMKLESSTVRRRLSTSIRYAKEKQKNWVSKAQDDFLLNAIWSLKIPTSGHDLKPDKAQVNEVNMGVSSQVSTSAQDVRNKTSKSRYISSPLGANFRPTTVNSMPKTSV